MPAPSLLPTWSVAPAAMVTELDENVEPSSVSVPRLTVVRPVIPSLPVSVRFPEPA